MSKHTPGPWFETKLGKLPRSVYPREQALGPICRIGNDYGLEQQLANAKLIATAPEMFQYLKNLQKADAERGILAYAQTTKYPTIKDQVAMATLTGLLGRKDTIKYSPEELSRFAYKIADAMMEARKGKEDE